MSWTLPQKTDWMIEQMAHEPTRSYAQEIYEVVKKHKPDYKQACEIGNAWGVSTMAILMAGEARLVSVDKNQPIRALEELRVNELLGRCDFKQFDSEDFWKQNQTKYDLIYIDGSHIYEDVYVDFMEGWKHLDKGGLFICDDIAHPANRKADPETMEPEYGVGHALWQMIIENKITKIGTTTRLFWTIK